MCSPRSIEDYEVLFWDGIWQQLSANRTSESGCRDADWVLRSWTFQQVLRIFKATIQLKSAWTVNFNDVFWCMLLRKRGLALLAASPPDGKQKPPRKTGKCSRRKGVTSIQFSLMLNANPVQLLSCDHFDVRIPGICRPKVSPGATFHTFSGNFSPFTSTVICLQSLQ